MLREPLDRRWTYQTRHGVLDCLMGWVTARRGQRLPEMERLGDFLVPHIDGIAASCDFDVRVGVVESLNTTIDLLGDLRATANVRGWRPSP